MPAFRRLGFGQLNRLRRGRLSNTQFASCPQSRQVMCLAGRPKQQLAISLVILEVVMASICPPSQLFHRLHLRNLQSSLQSNRVRR